MALASALRAAMIIFGSTIQTSVSETIRKPPLVEAQNAVGKQKKTAKNDFQYGGRSPS